jgi:hypothetical protein
MAANYRYNRPLCGSQRKAVTGMIVDPWFYAVAIPAIIMVGLSKSGFLGGVAVIGVPLLALNVDPVQAAGILLPILIAMDVVGVWAYRGTYHRRSLVILLPAAVVGIFIGYLAAAVVSEAMVRLIVGVIAFVFTVDYWTGLRPRGEPGQGGRIIGIICGVIAGFTSFVSHAGSPPVQLYLLPQRFRSEVYAGTMVMFFASVNLIKVPPYFLLGQFSTENLSTSAVLLPLAPLSMLVGIRLVRWLPQEPFYRIAYAGLFLMSLKLMWDGAAGILAAWG